MYVNSQRLLFYSSFLCVILIYGLQSIPRKSNAKDVETMWEELKIEANEEFLPTWRL